MRERSPSYGADAEQALRRSEEKYWELVQHANSIILRWDCQGRVTFFNEFAQNFFGFSEEEILGRSVVGTIVPETDSAGRDLTALMEDICNHPERHETNINENILKDGRRVWIAWTNRPVLGEGQELTEVLSVGVDITRQVLAEEAPRRSEERFRRLFESAADALLLADPSGRYVEANRAACESLGYSREELVKLRVQDIVVDYPEEEMLRHYRELHEKGPATYNAMQRRKDGSTFPVEARLSLFDYDEQTRILAVVRDITERQQAEERLRESENRFRYLFERASDGLFLGDSSGRFLEVNQAGCDSLGYTREEILGMTAEDIVVGYGNATMAEHWRLLREEGTLALECRHRRKDGSLIPVETRLTLFDYGGQTLALAVVRDVTERVRAEEERRAVEQRAEQQKKQFYRETIYSITGGRLDICDREALVPYVTRSEICTEVTAASQVSEARRDVEHVCRVHGLTGSRLDMFMVAVGEAITNALKHGSRGTVYAGGDDSEVWVGIEDDGPGIESLILPRAVLLRGFSTKPSLGLGYTVMLEAADEIHLKTDDTGTFVVLRKGLTEQEPEIDVRDLPDPWDNIPASS